MHSLTKWEGQNKPKISLLKFWHPPSSSLPDQRIHSQHSDAEMGRWQRYQLWHYFLLHTGGWSQKPRWHLEVEKKHQSEPVNTNLNSNSPYKVPKCLWCYRSQNLRFCSEQFEQCSQTKFESSCVGPGDGLSDSSVPLPTRDFSWFHTAVNSLLQRSCIFISIDTLLMPFHQEHQLALAFIISWTLLSADYFACLSYRITAALLCLELAVLNIFLIRTEWSVLISCCNKEHSEKRNTLMSNWISRLFFKM